jgi:DMSO/TMAO reductase YedYZ molybdopterin-dependent catalytic subunit
VTGAQDGGHPGPEDGKGRGRAGHGALPPGQDLRHELPVMHYGPVPVTADPGAWWMRFWGRMSTDADGPEDLTFTEGYSMSVRDLDTLPRSKVVADLHCGRGWSVQGNLWEGVAAKEILGRFPPAHDVTDVLVHAEYGYSASIRLEDLTSSRTLLATHLDGRPLAPEHGHPVRLIIPHLYSWKGPKWFRGWEYLTEPRRGFWEERGYHLHGDPWHEERYSYQEP